MTIDELKRALEEVYRMCKGPQYRRCLDCPFSDADGYCNLTSHPAAWGVDDWKEDSNATD